ncbi:hypothetical protein BIW11_04762 [Tropilaelaps mercedesae]|uniref:MRN complex-interacting protein N-terminal domain-containing protein n=1 Tax=Tropilaelaps mercedesae TaxID=418985 RepID=A0A1V9X2F4_9ACAR|nr:hypothetical protein BIW11_04762 [Tropilaelaps mercedesae]
MSPSKRFPTADSQQRNTKPASDNDNELFADVETPPRISSNGEIVPRTSEASSSDEGENKLGKSLSSGKTATKKFKASGAVKMDCNSSLKTSAGDAIAKEDGVIETANNEECQRNPGNCAKIGGPIRASKAGCDRSGQRLAGDSMRKASADGVTDTYTVASEKGGWRRRSLAKLMKFRYDDDDRDEGDLGKDSGGDTTSRTPGADGQTEDKEYSRRAETQTQPAVVTAKNDCTSFCGDEVRSSPESEQLLILLDATDQYQLRIYDTLSICHVLLTSARVAEPGEHFRPTCSILLFTKPMALAPCASFRLEVPSGRVVEMADRSVEWYYAIRCCRCGLCQVQQMKKTARFQCIVCRHRQKVSQELLRGKAKRCREIVQLLNKTAHPGATNFNSASLNLTIGPVCSDQQNVDAATSDIHYRGPASRAEAAESSAGHRLTHSFGRELPRGYTPNSAVVRPDEEMRAGKRKCTRPTTNERNRLPMSSTSNNKWLRKSGIDTSLETPWRQRSMGKLAAFRFEDRQNIDGGR